MRHIGKLCAMLVLLGALHGCAFATGDELLQAPKPPKNYLALQNELDAILKTGVVYTSPESGENRNTVQLKDLDNDGESEAISFFRTSAVSNQFMIYVHQKIGNAYIKMGGIEGSGIAIQSVDYPVLTPEGARGVLVSWQLTGDSTYGVSLYAFQNGKLYSVLESDYTALEIMDMDRDGAEELVTLTIDAQGKNYARLYDFDGQTMQLLGEATVAADAKSIVHLRSGYVNGWYPAVFAEERNESAVGLSTDIFVYDGKNFHNIALENEQTTSGGTYRPLSVYATDINGDGITEIPRAVLAAGYFADSADPHYLLDWYAYGLELPQLVRTTYHNTVEEWQMTIPQQWHDTVTISKDMGWNGLSCTVFAENRAPQENITLLRVYCLTGEARQYFTESENIILLNRSKTALYIAEIPEEAANSQLRLTADEVKAYFGLIAEEWNR